MTIELKNSLFSKFHYTFDENGHLRFLIGLDLREIKNQDGFLGANLIRYRLQYPSLKSKDPAEEIMINAGPAISMGQLPYFIHFAGVDNTIKPLFRYKYVLSVTVALEDHIKQNDHSKKIGLINSIRSKTSTIDYELPVISYEEPSSTGLSSINNLGFKKVMKGDLSNFLTGDAVVTKTDSHKFVIYEKSKNIEQFIQTTNKSKAEALGGFAINTKNITKEDLSKQNFLTIGLNSTKENIKLEYMAGYLFDDVAAEKWKPLTADILDGIIEPTLVRVASPAPYVNKYFIVGGE